MLTSDTLVETELFPQKYGVVGDRISCSSCAKTNDRMHFVTFYQNFKLNLAHGKFRQSGASNKSAFVGWRDHIPRLNTRMASLWYQLL